MIVYYQSNPHTEIYRDGGSLQLCFIASDDENYCIFMEVVSSSLEDSKRYKQPVLLKGSFYLNDIKSDDYIDFVTWEQIVILLKEIKKDIGQQKFLTGHFSLIEQIANCGGWLVR